VEWTKVVHNSIPCNSVNMIMYQMNNHTPFKQDHGITF
jgi:hypothetical protein